MKEIPLNGKYGKGKFTVVDDGDYEKAISHKLHVNNKGYVKLKFKNKDTFFHRYLLDINDERFIDHKNGNPLDNTRKNLRICDNKRNSFNKKTQTHSSKYKGVTWNKRLNRFVAQIKLNKKTHLGCFDYELDAAKAYDKAARVYFGEFSRTNFQEQS